jgi:hemerythrin
MIEHNYPDLPEHKKEHERVLAELRNRLFSLKYDFIDFDQLQDFLLEWFIQHTTIVDKKLAASLREDTAYSQ